MRDPIERLAWLLDSAFQIPGTRWRFGLDALIGLVPGLGEWVMLFAQSALVLWAVGRGPLRSSRHSRRPHGAQRGD